MFYKAMLKKKNNKKAFTLIELIVVIAIIGVLVAILVPTLSGFVGNAKTNTGKANARTVYGVAQAQLNQMISTGGSVGVAVYSNASGTATGTDFISMVSNQVGKVVSPTSYTITVASGVNGNYVSSVTYNLDATSSATAP